MHNVLKREKKQKTHVIIKKKNALAFKLLYTLKQNTLNFSKFLKRLYS